MPPASHVKYSIWTDGRLHNESLISERGYEIDKALLANYDCFIGAAEVLSRDSIKSASQPPITNTLSPPRINIVDQLDTSDVRAKRASLFPKTQPTLWGLHILQRTDRTMGRSLTSSRNREAFSSLIQCYFHLHGRLKGQSDHPFPSDHHSPSDDQSQSDHPSSRIYSHILQIWK